MADAVLIAMMVKGGGAAGGVESACATSVVTLAGAIASGNSAVVVWRGDASAVMICAGVLMDSSSDAGAISCVVEAATGSMSWSEYKRMMR